MWGNVNQEYKRRLNIISFIVLPIIMVMAIFIGIWIVRILNFEIDSTGILFVSISTIPLYLICIRAAYQKAKEKSSEDITKYKQPN